MIVEQFLKDIQRLIDMGTINPSAEITIEGEVEICYDDIDYIGNFRHNDLKINVNQCHYNNLILTSDPDV